ncbi:MAG TPA: DEAD/DEAH box helicase, partial [Dehalococcoidia bacterium]|nr:DEAD/DEAH box helicase [Dehalococcoidia bacterium]
MKLGGILKLIEEMPAYRRLLADLRRRQRGTVDVLDAAKPYVIAALYRELELPLMVITAQPENARRMQEQVSAWCGSKRVMLFPEPDALPYQHVVTDSTTGLERMQVLSALAGKGNGDGREPLVIASAPALIQKVIPFNSFTSAWHTVEVGMDIEPKRLLQRWQAIGYEREAIVEVPGTMSQRGGILDVYPPTGEFPVRIDFMGNTIDSMRFFDSHSQRSLGVISQIEIGPAAGAIDGGGCILDYLPEEAMLIVDEGERLQNAVELLKDEASRLLSDRLERGEVVDDIPTPYFGWEELGPKINSHFRLVLSSWEPPDEGQLHKLDFTPATSYVGQLPALINKTKQMLKQGRRLVLVSHQASRLSELLAETKTIAAPVTEVVRVPPPGSLTLVQGLLTGGWTAGGNVHLLTDVEIFGFIKQRRLSKKRPMPRQMLYVDITPGDYVVHVEHGIARFAGVTTMKNKEIPGEYMVLEYAGGDKLYIPVEQIDRVTRYIGASDHQPAMNRLGTPDWWRTRKKAKESVEIVALELLALYAVREVAPGFAFSPDTVWQQELEASFPYIETPDQMAAQKEVKKDMAEAMPMDRLILGDVGYGKTEVAIRAAFKAVMDGKQVVLLVPTTVLAQQHHTTFSQRLATFPVRIEVLSRFRSPKEQQAIIEGLANGSVDICIGTHRLLQKDVVFKDMGLLIIDEEQRFGVSHKEHLKKIRRSVDVLTLSATPIPRTLHMSLLGVRDMSTIETPPGERLPIKTHVAEYDERVVRGAILHEMERNGQVFFVHNRVQSIDFIAEKIQMLVPEARLAVAHGRMAEGELEA